ncbi:HAUS augmin-like complex subunit 1 [Chamberlinius hualienensis]
MDQKIYKVHKWLGKYFPNGVPEYEITNKSIDLLSKLQDLSTMQEELSDLVKQDLERKTSEYKAEAEAMELALKEVGLSSDLLTAESQNYLKMISQFYNILGIHDADETKAKLSVFNAYQDLLKTNSDLEVTTLLEDSVNELNETLKQRLHQLKKFESDIQANKSSAESKLKMKSIINENLTSNEECKKKISQLETVLSERRFSPSVSYEELRKNYEEIETLKSELSSLENKIARYHDLPADINIAKQVVLNIKDEIEKMNELLNLKMTATVATSEIIPHEG